MKERRKSVRKTSLEKRERGQVEIEKNEREREIEGKRIRGRE